MAYLPNSKDPAEVLAVVFDFSDTGDSAIKTPTLTIAVRWGDDNPVSPSLVKGTSAISGTTVTWLVSGGLNLNDYDLSCTVDSNTSTRRYVKGCTLPVRTAPSI